MTVYGEIPSACFQSKKVNCKNYFCAKWSKIVFARKFIPSKIKYITVFFNTAILSDMPFNKCGYTNKKNNMIPQDSYILH